MVGRRGEAFSSRVLRYASSLRGTKQYWQRQRSRLLSMVDTLGLPTIFFTHSAADLQWPELARLICPDNPDSRTARAKAVIENPALADWFFYHRVVKVFYLEVLGATEYWLRFEWQHRGSPHVHGLAWLPDTPDVKQLKDTATDTLKEEVISHADQLVSTINPAVLPDGSNLSDAAPPKVDPHICNRPYRDMLDIDEDLADLVATCQCHTRCSASYCLRTKHGKQECHFGYPKPLQPTTAIVTEDEPTLLTARNDGLINSYNPVQLSAWCANVDMQYIVSRHRVLQYCSKYVTKSEPRSQSLKEIFTTVVQGLRESSSNNSLKTVQKLLINTVIILSLDGSRAVEDCLVEGQRATALSIVDHYIGRPDSSHFNNMTLLEFARQYSMPKTLGVQPTPRSRRIVVIPRPYVSPDPTGEKYEHHCRQALMQHKPFR